MSSSYLSSNNFYSKVKTLSTKFDNIANEKTLTHDINSKFVSFYNGTFMLKPSGNDNYVTKFIVDNTYSDANIYLNVDTSNSNIGDLYTLIVICQSTNNSVFVHFDNNFYLVLCGDYSDSCEVNNRIVLEFTYDGEKFVNTDDNC